MYLHPTTPQPTTKPSLSTASTVPSSSGSLCLHVPAANLLIAGDTLFAGSVGRTDLPLGSTPQILDSITARLLPLPGETVVIPGHGPTTTIAHERATNPFLI